MRRVAYLGFVILLVMFLVSTKTNAGDEETLGYKQTESNDVVATFTSPMSPQELSSIVKENDVLPKEIYFEMHGVYGGYTPQPGEDIDTALKSMRKKHVKFLKFALTANKKNRKSLAKRNKNKAVGLDDLTKQLSRVLKDTNYGQLKFSGIRIENDEKVLPLLDRGLIQEFSTPTKDKTKEETEQETEYRDRRVYSSYHESWAPFGGTSNVTRWQTYQTFYFNNTGEFGSISTYEHETQIYNGSFADYDGYWSSNLPRAYKDTQFGDSIDNFTIGSSQASDIKTYTRYYTYIGLKPGSALSANVKIKGQKGHRWPSWCYSTWCIFADPGATTSALTDYNAPGNTKWIY